ncbi:sensor histidine kinase [Papillibacter cinnamivorans]|uniref:histidine kinase n=1 Tax=Papillibacter cinnamivorans DSM 12816 TaxID=1122930 RepID=A0A1W2BAF7_9FIRM|nr:HAMP domain-containing sensor histidine kinase [Papillibacter cinnamivorans]SMC69760.1 Signal transduction histidine kinase [Papillibacter cinnamivorans DSM 12816]
MKTIRRKYLSLFVAETLLVMLVVLVLFNAAMYVYLDRSARKELKAAFSTMQVLVERQLMISAFSDDNTDSALQGLSAALTASRLSGSIKFFIFDESFQVLFPRQTSGTLLTETLLEDIRGADFDAKAGEVIRAGNTTYFSGIPFEELAGIKLYIVFAADLTDSREMVYALNWMLAAVMLVALGIGFFFAGAAAKGISRPLQRVCAQAEEIGKGNFVPVPQEQSLREIASLCKSMDEMSARLRASDQAQRLFLQNASHELRTPLMSIQGYAEAIEADLGDDPKEAAHIIRAESIRLNALVGELLTLSRMENSFDCKPEALDLAELLSEYAYRLEGLAIKEKKRLIFETGVGSVPVTADERLLWQMIGNPASNCLRYAESEVEITLSLEDGTAVIHIRDDGPGFSEADLPHVFDRFYKGKGGNFGLGLSIAKKAAELSGAELSASNGPKGAVFEIRIKTDAKARVS